MTVYLDELGIGVEDGGEVCDVYVTWSMEVAPPESLLLPFSPSVFRDRSRPTAWFVLHRSNDLMPRTRDQAAEAHAHGVTAALFSPLFPYNRQASSSVQNDEAC